jgi:hypothetical protein
MMIRRATRSRHARADMRGFVVSGNDDGKHVGSVCVCVRRQSNAAMDEFQQ